MIWENGNSSKLFLKKINLKFLKTKISLEILKENADWLKPYAAFCVLRDKNNTNFNNWKTHKNTLQEKFLNF